MKTRSMKTLGAAIAATAVLFGAAPFRAADHPPAYRFQEAIDLMETKGDYAAAIRAFEDLAKGGDRNLAARSLLYVGLCYEKLGKDEARKAYERVLRDYGDQSEAAAQARKRLAALSGNGASKSSEMATRRVWAGPDVDVLGSVSPDGRYLSCVDWTTGDLALRDLATGKMRRITHEGSSTELRLSVISPDGKEVAYNWFAKDGSPELRLVRLDGSGPRILYSNKGVMAYPTDWSPDGKYILSTFDKFSDKSQRTWDISLVSAADGSVRVLKTLEVPGRAKFSPDGRYIAYDFPQQQDSSNRDIFLLAADGSREIRLVEHPADDLLLGWAPDGNSVLFASDRSGSMGALAPARGGWEAAGLARAGKAGHRARTNPDRVDAGWFLLLWPGDRAHERCLHR